MAGSCVNVFAPFRYLPNNIPKIPAQIMLKIIIRSFFKSDTLQWCTVFVGADCITWIKLGISIAMMILIILSPEEDRSKGH